MGRQPAKAELGGHFVPLLMDVLDEASICAAAAEVGRALGSERLAGLVNNAGIALGGPLALQKKEDFLAHIHVNLLGPFLVTQAFLPLLGTDPGRKGDPGRIVNMSSVAGTMGSPFLGGYAASKHALEGMSESLRRELALYGIKVVIVGPGSVVTPIWDKAETRGNDEFKGTDYEKPLERFQKYVLKVGRNGLEPREIAEIVLKALTAPRPRLRYAVVRDPWTHWTLPRLLPRRWLDRAITKAFLLQP